MNFERLPGDRLDSIDEMHHKISLGKDDEQIYGKDILDTPSYVLGRFRFYFRHCEDPESVVVSFYFMGKFIKVQRCDFIQFIFLVMFLIAAMLLVVAFAKSN